MRASDIEPGQRYGRLVDPTTWRIVTGGSDTDLDAAIDDAIAAKERT